MTRSGRISRSRVLRGNILQQSEEEAQRSTQITAAEEISWQQHGPRSYIPDQPTGENLPEYSINRQVGGSYNYEEVRRQTRLKRNRMKGLRKARRAKKLKLQAERKKAGLPLIAKRKGGFKKRRNWRKAFSKYRRQRWDVAKEDDSQDGDFDVTAAEKHAGLQSLDE